jgi:ribosomal protein S18 acetylase RimI-like enzyme
MDLFSKIEIDSSKNSLKKSKLREFFKMARIVINRVRFNENLQLQKICKQTFSETYASGNTEDDMTKYLSEEFSLDKLEAELNDKDSAFYFALLDSRPVGYLKINLGQSQTEMQGGNSMEIQRIYVLNEFQGKKVGKSLYKKALEIAQQKRLDFIWLGVWEENPKAIQFYEKIGFKAFDKHHFVVGDDDQTDIMMKKHVNKVS